MMTVTAACVVVCDDDIRTQTTNVKHHAPEQLFFAPGAERLFCRFRKTKVAEAEEVRFGALNFGSSNRLASANDAKFFVEFRTDGVLSALAESGKQRDRVNAIFAAQHGQCAAVFVVWM